MSTLGFTNNVHRLSWRDRLHDAFPPRRRRSIVIQALMMACLLAAWFMPHLLVLLKLGVATWDPLGAFVGDAESIHTIEAQPELAAALEHIGDTYRRIQTAGLSVVAFFVGLAAMGRSPGKSTLYRQWLARTPWTPDRPLPVRRIGPGFGTAVWLALLLLLAAATGVSGWIAIACAAAGLCWAAQDLIRLGEHRWMCVTLCIALLLAVRLAFVDPLRPASAAIAIAAGLAALVLARRALWHLAWRTDLEKRWAREFRQDADSYREYGQMIPVLRVAPITPPQPWTKRQLLGASAIVGLVLCNIAAAEHAMFPAEDAGPLAFLGLFGLVVGGILVRLSFWTRGRQPAFSWWMRLRNGRLLLPRSDVLWLAPLAAAPAGIAAFAVAAMVGLALPEAIGLSGMAALFALCAIGPSRRWYYLCGGGRIAVSSSLMAQKTGKSTRTTSQSDLELDL